MRWLTRLWEKKHERSSGQEDAEKITRSRRELAVAQGRLRRVDAELRSLQR